MAANPTDSVSDTTASLISRHRKMIICIALALIAAAIGFLVVPTMPAVLAVIFSTSLQWKAIVAGSFALAVPGFWLFSATLRTTKGSLGANTRRGSIWQHVKFFLKLVASTVMLLPFFMVIMPGSMLAVTATFVKSNTAMITASQALAMTAVQLKAYAVATVAKLWAGIGFGALISGGLMAGWQLLGTLFVGLSTYLTFTKQWRRAGTAVWWFGKGMVFFSWSLLGLLWGKLAVLGDVLLDAADQGIDALLKLAEFKVSFGTAMSAIADSLAQTAQQCLSWFGLATVSGTSAGPGVLTVVGSSAADIYHAGVNAGSSGVEAMSLPGTVEQACAQLPTVAKEAVQLGTEVTFGAAGLCSLVGWIKGDNNVSADGATLGF